MIFTLGSSVHYFTVRIWTCAKLASAGGKSSSTARQISIKGSLLVGQGKLRRPARRLSGLRALSRVGRAEGRAAAASVAGCGRPLGCLPGQGQPTTCRGTALNTVTRLVNATYCAFSIRTTQLRTSEFEFYSGGIQAFTVNFKRLGLFDLIPLQKPRSKYQAPLTAYYLHDIFFSVSAITILIDCTKYTLPS